MLVLVLLRAGTGAASEMFFYQLVPLQNLSVHSHAFVGAAVGIAQGEIVGQWQCLNDY